VGSDSNDDDIKFRDRVAIEAMGSLIEVWNNGFRTYLISNKLDISVDDSVIEQIAAMSYRFANAMRKARLGAFE